MNEKLKYTLLVTAYLIVVIGVLVGTYFLLNPIRQRNLSKETLQKYESVVQDVVRVEEAEFEGPIITEKYYGFDKDDNNIATLYTATQTNTFGSITIIVALAPDGSIIGIKAQEVNQTLLVGDITESINNFTGSISDTYDGVSGATRAKEAVEAILEAIRASHGDVLPPKPSVGVKFVEAVTEGRKYQVTRNATYVGSNQGLLSFYIIVDNDGKLVSFEEVLYEHTGGSNFHDKAILFFNALIGNNISNPTEGLSYDEENDIYDGQADVTNSTNAILNIIKDLDKFITIENLTEGIENLGDNKYRVTKKAVYVGSTEGLLSFEFQLDNDGILISYEEILYEHTGGENFHDKAIAFLDTLVNKNIKTLTNAELDGQSGVTNSSTTILTMLKELATYIEGE